MNRLRSPQPPAHSLVIPEYLESMAREIRRKERRQARAENFAADLLSWIIAGVCVIIAAVNS